MVSLLLAFYFSMLVPRLPYPLLIGPYETWSDCASVREWMDHRGYETDGCGPMPVPQLSVHLEVGYLP